MALLRQPSPKARQAVTLVEILVVMALIAIVAAFVLRFGGVTQLAERAKIRATQRIISVLDQLVYQKFQQASRGSRARVLPVDMSLSLDRSDCSYSESARRRATVVARLRTVRQELPELFLIGNQQYRYHSPLQLGSVWVNGDFAPLDPGSALSDPMCRRAQSRAELPPGAQRFIAILERAATNGTLANHQPETARAECLYVIVADDPETGTVPGIPDSNLRDSDGDGLLEIVDAWDNPILFFLCPYGYRSSLQPAKGKPPVPTVSGSLLDPAGLVTDPVYITRGPGGWQVVDEALFPITLWPNRQRPFAYRLYPLIVSAGPDGLFGLMRDPNDPSYFDRSATRLRDLPSPGTSSEVGADADNLDNHTASTLWEAQ